ncbi:MAG TPA: hypothetical protein VJV77_00725, partial [Casimicrobiaceae bacterium]|nr:hypothetical protein [Casimicrobiaceae bacterium]
AAAACDLLASVLGTAPRIALRVLDRSDWHRHAEVPAYGVTHVAGSGDLVAGASAADPWHDVSDHFSRNLPAPALAALVRVHGVDAENRRGPALDALAESLIVHEVAHLHATQIGLNFPARWLEEAFANYVLVAVLGETDPDGLRRVGSLAEAASLLNEDLPTLATFERDFGEMDVVPSVLAELAITRGVYAAYAQEGTAPLARLAEAFRPGTRPRDADYELGRMLATRVHPAIAAIADMFSDRRAELAA